MSRQRGIVSQNLYALKTPMSSSGLLKADVEDNDDRNHNSHEVL